jgi:hypothetical protein
VAAKHSTTQVISYSLEDLFNDQDPDLVHDTVAAVLAWVPGTSKASQAQPFRFDVEHTTRRSKSAVQIDLSWAIEPLARRVPGLPGHVQRLRTGKTVQREHITELAAYGLALVAISCLMPGRRVKTVRRGLAPDLVFDLTPNAIRGVEVAGRTRGGRTALASVRNGALPKSGKPAKVGKYAQLMAMSEVVEAHLSLWCATPRVSIMEQVKP